jgi:glycosyltransferase 2 family protein
VRSRLLRLGLRLIGPLLLVVVLWRMDDLSGLLTALLRVDVAAVVVAVSLNAVNIHFKVVRWRVLLDMRGHQYGLGAAWRAFLPALYLGMLTPGRVGDLLRVQYVRHEIDVPYSDGLAVVVMDRFSDLYVLLCFVLVALGHFEHILRGDLGIVSWVGFALIALAPLGLLIRGPADRVLQRIYARIAPEGSQDGAKRFLDALRELVRPRLLAVLPLTLAAFMVNYLQGYVIAHGLGIEIAFVDVMLILAITSLLSLLPISVSGIGTRELFLALVFPAIGLAAEQGVAFGMTVFAVIYLATAFAGLVAWQLSPPTFRASSSPEAPPGEGEGEGEETS